MKFRIIHFLIFLTIFFQSKILIKSDVMSSIIFHRQTFKIWLEPVSSGVLEQICYHLDKLVLRHWLKLENCYTKLGKCEILHFSFYLRQCFSSKCALLKFIIFSEKKHFTEHAALQFYDHITH